MSEPQNDLSDIKKISGKSAILGKRYERLAPDNQPSDNRIKNKARQQIAELLSVSVLHSRPCLCGEDRADKYEVLSLVDKYNLPSRNILCQNCGIIRIDPLPDEDFYRQVYSNLFWKMKHGNAELTQNRFDLSVRRAIPYRNYLQEKCSIHAKRVLEIGASYGAGLFVLKDQGCRCLVGFDYDENFIKKGLKYSGVDLRQGGIKEAVEDGKKYDVIILRHVLEHFLYPINELHELKSIISSKGMVFIEVPGVINSNYWSYDPLQYFEIFHPFSFSLKTLNMLMRMAGFSMIDGNDHIYSLWKIDESINYSFEISSDEYMNITNHLINADLKRYNIEKFNSTYLGKFYNFTSNLMNLINNKLSHK